MIEHIFAGIGIYSTGFFLTYLVYRRYGRRDYDEAFGHGLFWIISLPVFPFILLQDYLTKKRKNKEHQ